MHEAELILTLAGALTGALCLGYVTHRLGLSPIVGYLLAGVLVGPYTPGFVANASLAEQFAEIGVILLMFGVGLQFHVEELFAVRRTAIPGAVIGMAVSGLLAAAAASTIAGWPLRQAAVFGLALSVSSTVVLVRLLADRGELHTSTGHLAIGWLVVEDLLTVVILVVLPTLTRTTNASGLAVAIGWTLLKVGALVVLIALGGTRLIPAILDRVAATRSRELFTLTVLVLALGIAVLSAVLFGVSMALGAFVSGLVVGRSEYSVRAAVDALPMRDAFAVLFFVSVGMLLDPQQLLTNAWLVAGALLVVLVAKPLAAALLLAVQRAPMRVVVAIPAALAQIGEFSFIVVNLGRDLQVLPAAAINIVVAVSIVSIVINPFAARLRRPAERWLTRITAASQRPSPIEDEGVSSSLDPGGRAIVVGYGPTGRTVTRLLTDNGIAPTIVELNIDAVRELRGVGISAIYGDARSAATLVSAGLPHASTLIVSTGEDSTATITAARELNAGVHVFARAPYLRDLTPIRRAGADEVFTGEGEVALAMTEAVLRRLGASPDQIDRERARVREELFGRNGRSKQTPQQPPELEHEPRGRNREA